MKRRSSLRRTAAPIPVALMVFASRQSPSSDCLLGGFARCAAPTHRPRARGNRLDDVVIAGAPANVAFKLFANGAIVELVAFAADDVDVSNDQAGGEEAARHPMISAEALLHRRQRATARGKP